MPLSLALTAALLVAQLDYRSAEADSPRIPFSFDAAPLESPVDSALPERSPRDIDGDLDSEVRPASGTTNQGGRYGAGPATPPGGWTDAIDTAAGNQASLQPVRDEETELAKQLVARLVRVPGVEQSEGEPISLLAALRRGGNPSQTVELYWRVALATAEYQAGVQDAERIAGWRSALSGRDPAIDLAYRQAAARAAEARAQWLSARHELQRVSGGQASGAKLPLASDLPHAGSYLLNFDKIFPSAASAPRDAVRGRDVIPAHHEALRARAELLAAAEQRVTSVDAALRQGQSGAAGQLLPALRDLQSAREGFLRSLGVYNQEIARYALTIPGVDRRETLVSILIKTKPPENATRSVLQTSGVESAEGQRAAPAIWTVPQESAPEAEQIRPRLIPEAEPRIVPQDARLPPLAPTPAATFPLSPQPAAAEFVPAGTGVAPDWTPEPNRQHSWDADESATLPPPSLRP